MKTNAKPHEQRRIIFNANAKLGLKKKPQKFAADQGEAGADADNWQETLEGYALVWGQPGDTQNLSDDRGGYKVRLAPGSAKFTTPTLALFHHNFSQIIGNTENGTLRLLPDDTGVRVEIDLPDTTVGHDVATLVGEKYVTGMSFSMIPGEFSESEENGQKILTATNFTCDEVTVTGIASFKSTSIDVAPDDEAAAAADDDDDEPAEDDGDYAKHLAAESVKLEQKRLAMYTL